MRARTAAVKTYTPSASMTNGVSGSCAKHAVTRGPSLGKHHAQKNLSELRLDRTGTVGEDLGDRRLKLVLCERL
jgi:hypothetical protein